MTDKVTEAEPASRPARRSKVASATATQVAEHLFLTRQRITALADVEHILLRLPDGRFDLVDCRRRYVEFLRQSRRSQKSAQDQAFLREKTKALEIRNAQRLGQLFPTQVAMEVIDQYVADVTVALTNIPARAAGGDRVLRRRVETAVLEARKEISGRIAERARQALPEVAAETGANDEDA